MKFYLKVFVLFLIVLSTCSFAQANKQNSGNKISGKVIDAQTGKPVEYATVVVFRSTDKRQLTGSITKADGNFEIPDIRADKYYLEISFIGYEKQIVPFDLAGSSSSLDLGTIKIDQKALSLKNVVVEGQRVPFTYQVDKKVINVDKFATSVSGTAVDVLENIPSVQVDVEGNVSLRGSGSFKVLIDGRPSIVDAQDLLQQIPASSIENIEIITNPSVKYDPEGIAGIINIVLKKNENNGISGVANLSGGLKDKYGSDFLMEYKNPAYSAILGMDLRKMTMINTRTEERRYDYQGSTLFINSSGDGNWHRNGYGMRGSLNLNLSDNDVLGFGGRYRDRNMQNFSSSNYTESPTGIDQLPLNYRNISEGNRTGNGYALSMNFQHKFPMKGHELTADVRYESDKGDDQSITELWNSQMITDGKKTTEGGPGTEFESKIDYTLPFNEFNKFEAGLDGQSEFSDQSTGYFEYNITTNQYLQNLNYSYATKSRNDEYSVYSVYSGMLGDLGYQAGIRGEYTYRNLEIPAKNAVFNVDRWDFFPTFHFSYKLPSGQQFIASYAKRIHRPDGWELEPFDTWIDANTIHRGNPGLQPELIDSYEFGFQTLLGNVVSLSTELYHRVNNSKIEGLRSVYAENVTLQTFDNIGKDYSTGAEIMGSVEFWKLWSIDLMGNIFDYRLKTDVNGESGSKESFNWRTRMSNSLKISSTLHLQLNADYNSPTISYQGRTESSFSLDMAVKKEFWDRMLSLTLQARNILNTARWQSTTESNGYYSHSNTLREAPMIMLNLRYTINNFKQQRDKDSNGGDDFNYNE